MNLTLKRGVTAVVCLVMVLMICLTLSACREQDVNDNLFATKQDTQVSFGGRNDWKNSDDFTITYDGNDHFVASGSASTMSAEQGTAWGNLDEGSEYVIVTIKMEVGSNIISGWRSTDEQNKAFEESEIDGVNIKRTSYNGVVGEKEYVLGLTNGDKPLHADAPIWRAEVTSPAVEGEETSVAVYTVDFSSFFAE